MKKIALFLLVLFVSTSAFAAVAPKPAVVPPAATQTGMAGKYAIGDWGGWNVLSYGVNSDIIASAGTYYLSTGSVYGFLLKGDYLLAKINDVQPCVGAYYTSDSTGASGTIGVLYGLGAMLATNLSVGADFILLTYTKTGAATTTSILPGAVFKASFVL